jgi:hypothetical protein
MKNEPKLQSCVLSMQKGWRWCTCFEFWYRLQHQYFIYLALRCRRERTRVCIGEARGRESDTCAISPICHTLAEFWPQSFLNPAAYAARRTYTQLLRTWLNLHCGASRRLSGCHLHSLRHDTLWNSTALSFLRCFHPNPLKFLRISLHNLAAERSLNVVVLSLSFSFARGGWISKILLCTPALGWKKAFCVCKREKRVIKDFATFVVRKLSRLLRYLKNYLLSCSPWRSNYPHN